MLLNAYKNIRLLSEQICAPLKKEDYVLQPIVDVSPPKWHLGHTTWFFETFVLKPHFEGYSEFNADYNFVFNSYYESVGARVIRTDRGNLSRPDVDDVYRYRKHVDEAMERFLTGHEVHDDLIELMELGFNHEQQHQELLLTDIKYILGNNPLFPAYDENYQFHNDRHSGNTFSDWITITEGIYEIGHNGQGFCFDNELSKHRVFLDTYHICAQPVTNKDYMAFILAGGYQDFRFWHAEGWDWVKTNEVKAPMYWHQINGAWYNYTLRGLVPVDPNGLLNHVSYYEASAFAAWKEMRLPTEFEWEVAADKLDWGRRWEWTESAYLPYPGFKKAEGALGEYNGKFMVNQMVLRGSSDVTSPGHSRKTYRNFFHPHLRWQYTGIRLAK
ncbi:ergothioneine biosynthesis protein EgtB [Pedobacter sp. HMF7647]|uniref:Ergothioneine biosynthesis protein EgtB n=1 Tax=Hufsiella arboris TaxID=2695275 RepID=A0A7K1YFB8_9SPHI|nr:ergothioneine biosynthesis protein EgtB [Hufsiella arboris]MXV53303.1 ergothioneine biosynthesis protein EgtB [Hufsiella arboris]